MTRLERLLPVLSALSGTTLRLWRAQTPGGTPTPNGGAKFQPIPNVEGAWLEIRGQGEGNHGASELAEIVGAVLDAEQETTQVAAELSGRYEEIDLIYTISEILGHTIRLDEAANRILREVSAVVRARRATLLVHDPRANVLRLVAARGVELGEVEPIEGDDPKSVAARCRPAESVGGDFYNLLSLHGERIGVMIGDVSSHGFGAALIMALAMAASGIHAETAESPHEALRRLEMSLAEELAETEMFLTLCYAVADPANGTLTFANAGHPHAFLVSTETGAVTRLQATRPPLGLGDGGQERVLPFERGKAILCLFTDGLADARGPSGERFGEPRVLSHVVNLRSRPARHILEAVFTDIAAFTGGAPANDDRTLVLLKV